MSSSDLENKAVQSESLGFSYVVGVDALKNIDLSLDCGACAFLYGDFQSGKSTLFKLLFGYEKRYSGSLKLFGRELKSYKKADDRSIFAVFDTPLLKNGLTATKNVEKLLRFCGEENAEERAKNAINEVGLGEKAREKVSNLSDFDKFLVHLASFSARKRRLALLDEPFFGLPLSQKVELLTKYLAAFRQNKTAALIATTDRELVKAFDLRTVMLFRGEKCFDGDYKTSKYFE